MKEKSKESKEYSIECKDDGYHCMSKGGHVSGPHKNYHDATEAGEAYANGGEVDSPPDGFYGRHGDVYGESKGGIVPNDPDKWIQGAIKKKGALHKELGVKQGEKIPKSKLDHAAASGGKLGQRARFAENVRGLSKK